VIPLPKGEEDWYGNENWKGRLSTKKKVMEINKDTHREDGEAVGAEEDQAAEKQWDHIKNADGQAGRIDDNGNQSTRAIDEQWSEQSLADETWDVEGESYATGNEEWPSKQQHRDEDDVETKPVPGIIHTIGVYLTENYTRLAQHEIIPTPNSNAFDFILLVTLATDTMLRKCAKDVLYQVNCARKAQQDDNKDRNLSSDEGNNHTQPEDVELPQSIPTNIDVSAPEQPDSSFAEPSSVVRSKARISGDGDWLLIDLSSIVIHFMTPESKAFWNLKELWGKGGDRYFREEIARLAEETTPILRNGRPYTAPMARDPADPFMAVKEREAYGQLARRDQKDTRTERNRKVLRRAKGFALDAVPVWQSEELKLIKSMQR